MGHGPVTAGGVALQRIVIFGLVSICLVVALSPAADTPKLTGLKCPVAAENEVGSAFNLNFGGAKIYFCCDDCLRSFKDEKDKSRKERLVSRANQQLAATGQAKQVRCPLEGKPHKATVTAIVGVSKVAFCCETCRDKISKAKASEQVELVFGSKPFSKGFKVDVQGKADKAAAPNGKEPREITETEIRRLIEVQERHTERLMKIKGVVGTAVGTDAKGEPVIKVLVEKKDAARNIPPKLEGIPVEIEVTGPIKPL